MSEYLSNATDVDDQTSANESHLWTLPSHTIPLEAQTEVDALLLTTVVVADALSNSDTVECKSVGEDPFDFPTAVPYPPPILLKPSRTEGSEAGLLNATGKRLAADKAKEVSTAQLKRQKTRLAAASRCRVHRKEAANTSQVRKWATPLETKLESDKLKTSATSYEAIPEHRSQSSRDTFSFISAGKKHTLPLVSPRSPTNKQDSSAKPSPPPTREMSALSSILDLRVCGVLEKLMKDDGFSYKAWDGSNSHPVLDSLKRVVVVLIGKPGGDYNIASERVFKFIQHLGNSEPFTRGETQHLRGKFPAVNAGISLGPGCTFPSRVGVGSHDEMVEKLLNNKDVQRLASHQDAAFKLWHPKLYAHYDQMSVKLRGRIPSLQKNFKQSVFTSMAFNFPPNVRTGNPLTYADHFAAREGRWMKGLNLWSKFVDGKLQ
ncbi:hypothetical protein CPB83DRAFT_865086 [Crepidotus variabilis]|uniref:Uncharacterized protein n=1 Tax=Crepidotus variabilis TaxID=179855 RepID=A0A9P6E3T0_9AGAR|nr:hypothetical protein CPB83DRAFT_865086 [Crepidotus variabilis]